MWGFVVQLGASLILGSAARMLAKDRNQRPGLPRTGKVTDAEPDGALPVVYGLQRVPANIVYATTSDSGNYLWLVGALAHGPVAGIDRVYLDGIEAADANGRGKAGTPSPSHDFLGYVAVWKAYGGYGQLAVEPMERGTKTVSTTDGTPITGNKDRRRITTSTAHGYSVGDVIDLVGVTACVAGFGYVVMAVGSATVFDVFQENAGTASGGGGTAEHYTPSILDALHGGKGVAYVIVRCRSDGGRFPTMPTPPSLEVEVRGRVMRDPRAYTVKSVTATATASAYTGYASTTDLTVAAHGYAEGDIVKVSAHSGDGAYNGEHRILRVVDANTIRLPILYTTSGTASVEKLTYSTTPALCIREYLSHPVYGIAASAAELNDTEIGTEATYQEVLVEAPVVNSPTFTNLRVITQIVTDGADAEVTTEIPHDYTTGDDVRIEGFDDVVAGALNGVKSITVTGASTFTFPSAAAAGTYNPDTREIPPFHPDDPPTTINIGFAIAVSTTEPRFSCSGIVDTGRPVRENLEDLLTSCRGSLVYEGGVFRPYTRRVKSAESFAVTDDTVVGDWSVGLPGQRELANIVRATYRNPDRGYVPDAVDYPLPGMPNLLLTDTDNGLVLRKEIDLPFTSRRATAQQIAQVLRLESRFGIVCAVTVKEEGLKLRMWDVVPVTRSACGWVAKSFWVAGVEILPDALVRLTLLEYDASCYTLPAGDDTPYEPAASVPRGATVTLGGIRGYRIINDNYRIKDLFRLPSLSTAGPRSYQHDGAGNNVTVLTSSGTTITVAAHSVREGTDENAATLDISYGGNTCTGTLSVVNYVYTDNPDKVDVSSPTYVATANIVDLSGADGRYFVGTITPNAGAGTGIGGGAGGSSTALI